MPFDVNRFVRTYQGFVVSAVILLFCAVGFFLGALPAAQKVLGEFDAMRSLSGDVVSLRQKLTLLNSLDESELRNNLATGVSAVPADKSLPSIFATIEALSSQTGASIVDMGIAAGGTVATASAKTATTPLEKQVGTHIVPFAVTIQGAMPTIQQFITLAPGVRRLLRIRTFSITAPKADHPLIVSLAMDAFYEPFPTTLGKAGAPITALSDSEQQTLTTLSQLPQVAAAAPAALLPQVGPGKPNPFAP